MSFFDKLILSFCRLGVAGLDPKAPGTWGTAIACLLAPYIFLPLSLPWRVVLLVVIFVVGGLASMHCANGSRKSAKNWRHCQSWLMLTPIRKIIDCRRISGLIFRI